MCVRRMIVIALSGVLVLGLASPASAGLTWKQRSARVRYQTVYVPKWTTSENVWTIRAAARRFGVSGGEMLCVAQRESGLNEHAVNATSGTSGLFQHMPRYWPGRVASYNHAVPEWLEVSSDVFQSRANALVSAWMISRYGWSPWGGGC